VRRFSCDVLVIGGGVAGSAAAISAARCGARTLLVEKEAYLGGAGYAGMFQYVCGLYLNGTAAPSDTLNEGLTREIARKLLQASPGRTIRKAGRVYLLPYDRDELAALLGSLCSGESRLELLRNCTATAAETRSGELISVTTSGPGGEQSITAAMVVDCSGSGAIAAMTGAEVELSSPGERQLAGYVVRVKGLKNRGEGLPIEVPYRLALAVNGEKLPPLLRFTTFTPGDAADEGFCKLSLDGEAGPGRDERAHLDASAMLACLAGEIPTFRDAVIVGSSLTVLDREGGRVSGHYTLTRDDILNAQKFPDGVVKNAWPIELWDRSKGTVYAYVPRDDYYEIPFRCLMVKGVGNLLTAGRCISVTREALGSTRVMGACMALGEQAGRSAAYRVLKGRYPERMTASVRE
jgi:FAD dependent oxidoreductase